MRTNRPRRGQKRKPINTLTRYARARIQALVLNDKRNRTRGAQTNLAEQVGVTPECICQISRGSSGLGLDTAESLAQAFGMSFPDFVRAAYEWDAAGRPSFSTGSNQSEKVSA